jgi:hypothetical protein
MNYKKTFIVAVLVFVAGMMAVACEEVPEKPQETVPDIPVPFDVSAMTGADSISVSWDYDRDFIYSGFLIERSEDGEVTWTELVTVSGSPYHDRSLRAGVVYWYRIAAIDQNGIKGLRSLSVPARAAVFALHINDGAPLTNTRDVLLTWTAPTTTQNVRFSEDPSYAGVQWRDFVAVFNFTLSSGDGIKTVYAQFLDDGGHLTHTVSSTIELDTYSEIDSLTLTTLTARPDTIPPGGTVNFEVVAANLELDGYSLIFIEGMGSDPLTARDNGVGGDNEAGDGIYGIDFTFAEFFREPSMRCSAIFFDAAGNPSAEREFAETLYMSDPPEEVTLELVTVQADSVTLRWNRSLEQHFSSYNIYRDTAPITDPPTQAVLVQKITQQDVVTFIDTGVVTGNTYHYRIYVVNDLEEGTGSNEVTVPR